MTSRIYRNFNVASAALRSKAVASPHGVPPGLDVIKGYITFFMLNSTEHEISTHKNLSAEK